MIEIKAEGRVYLFHDREILDDLDMRADEVREDGTPVMPAPLALDPEAAAGEMLAIAYGAVADGQGRALEPGHAGYAPLRDRMAGALMRMMR